MKAEEPRTMDQLWLRRGVALFLILGVTARLLRYLLQFPLWGDEAFIALNVVDRDFLELTQGLRFNQIAPVLFLWIERGLFMLFGSAELTLRLPSLLAGVVALLLFARFARLTAPRLTATLAVAVLAVSYYPIRHSCEVKPYAFDLLMAVLLLTLAAHWLRAPVRANALKWLTLSAPVALLGSYPAVLVAGGVSVALLPTVLRKRDRATWTWFALYNCSMLVTFALSYRFIGQQQYASMGAEDNDYWQTWFVPGRTVDFFRFVLLSHTGNLFAYPIGGTNGGSTLTLLLCVLGGRQLWQSKQRSLLLLLTMPFVLTFIAAILQRYPYGGSARVAQHLAAPICLLAAFGITRIITTVHRFGVSQARMAALTFCVLGMIGVGAMVRDVLKPYKTRADRDVRDWCQRIASRAGADSAIIVDGPPRLYPTFEWYLRRHADDQRSPLGRVSRPVRTGLETRPTVQITKIRVGDTAKRDYAMRHHVHELRFYRIKDRIAATIVGVESRVDYRLIDREWKAFDLGSMPEAICGCEVRTWERDRSRSHLRPRSPNK